MAVRKRGAAKGGVRAAAGASTSYTGVAPRPGRVTGVQDPTLQLVRQREDERQLDLGQNHAWLSRRGWLPYRTMREMLLDSKVEQALSVRTKPLRTLNFSIVCRDPRIRAAVDTIIRAVREEAFRTLIQNAHAFGYAPHEKVFVQKDLEVEPRQDSAQDQEVKPFTLPGAWCIKEFAPLVPDPACTAVIRGKDDGSFAGLKVRGSDLSGRWKELGPEKCLVFAPERITDEYPGNAALVTAYRGWFGKQSTIYWALRFCERRTGGNYKGRAPRIKLPNPAAGGPEIDAQEDLRQKADDAKSGNSIVLPSDRDAKGNYLWDLEVLSLDPRGDQFLTLIRYFDLMIDWALLGGPELAATQSSKWGSYAQTAVHTSTFENVCQATIDALERCFNDWVIPQLLALNFPPPWPPCRMEIEKVRGWDRELAKDVAGKMGLEQIGDVVATARRAGIPIDMKRLRGLKPPRPQITGGEGSTSDPPQTDEPEDVNDE